MPEQRIMLVDIHGPFAGQERPYRNKQVAENAIATGYARLPGDVPPEVAGTSLPENFPVRDELLAAGIETLEDVPRSVSELKALPGVGKVAAARILAALER